VPVQDGQDAGRGQLFGRQGVCTHRHGALLCRKGDQQAPDGRQRTHGEYRPPAREETGELMFVQVRNEIAVLKRVSMGHRNILTLVDYFETMNNRTRRCLACATRPHS